MPRLLQTDLILFLFFLDGRFWRCARDTRIGLRILTQWYNLDSAEETYTQSDRVFHFFSKQEHPWTT